MPKTSARQRMISIQGLKKSFGDTVIYDNFDIELPQEELISIFGPNGCGKSTLINMISGLMPMDAGEVLYDGQTIKETKISYVFQNYREALFPWLRAIDNIHYPLKVMGLPRRTREERVEQLLADFEIKIDLNAYPYTLSGGQQQTVSILRALVTEPEVLFLDEPFSALDYEMTLFMREQIQKIYLKTGTTTLLVSHDLEEAVQLADKVLLLTRRPTRVAEIVDVGLPWPRTTQVTTDSRFVDIKRHCLEVFWREVKAS
ncbi:ABC transporter ATP-binding protein [Pelagibius marinus]|uniref:ABC transporter ATP-binding protein n=1 Tax=Pelagibius marinus TaxID=2762760 RepID=UPI0018728EDD|nr:ABC transporter ATP-binding protein [Pelagibius marinus]